MPDFHQARERMQDALAQELAGPKPLGKPLDLTKPVVFTTWEESWGPWYDAATGEEQQALPDKLDSDKLMRDLQDFLRKPREGGEEGR